MPKLNEPHKRLWLVVFLVLLSLFTFTRSARAQEIMGGSRIPAGTIFDNDALLIGDDVILDGTVLGDVLAIGRTVTVNGNVDGSLVTLAETVIVNGEVDGSVFSGALTLEAGDQAAIGRSAYFVGARLVTQPESQIGRDLVASTLGAQLNGNVGRDVKAVIGLIEIVDRAIQSFDIQPDLSDLRISVPRAPEAEEATMAQGANPLTGLDRSKQARYVRPAGGLLYQATIQDEDQPPGEQANQNETIAWFQEQGRLLVQYLIVGALAAWIVPSRFYRWSDRLRHRPVASGLYGFVGFITGFAGAVILFVLFLVTGIGLATIALNGLALATWSLGFSSTWLAFSVFLLFVIFLSKVIVSYLGGLLILERLAPRAARYWIWPLLLGLVLYVLLRAIPFLGLAVGLLATFFGLGAAILALNRNDALSSKVVDEEE
ncbi:MAG: hypothetical protein PVH03_11475 [Chloroflexota bacterium]|jgi:hypothetical protein